MLVTGNGTISDEGSWCPDDRNVPNAVFFMLDFDSLRDACGDKRQGKPEKCAAPRKKPQNYRADSA